MAENNVVVAHRSIENNENYRKKAKANENIM
jgi:hypothetical protein